MKTSPSQRQKKVGPMKGQKYGKPRGRTCRWTPELDEVLKTAWERGACGPLEERSGNSSLPGRGGRLRSVRLRFPLVVQNLACGRRST